MATDHEPIPLQNLQHFLIEQTSAEYEQRVRERNAQDLRERQ